MNSAPQAQTFNAGRTLVCFALEEEAAPFRIVAADRAEVGILITGIGRRNAHAALSRLLAKQTPGRVLSCGFAGGLDPALAAGDALFETADAQLAAALAVAGAKPARFYCSERIAVSAVEKAALRRNTGADAVEMESATVQALCRERAIPCATLRVVLDTAGENLPLDFNKFAGPDLNPDRMRLVVALARRPGKLPGLLRLRKNARFAAQCLADVLARLIWPR